MDTEGQVPARVDHLVYGAPSLSEGVERIAELLGERPVAGGRHPRYGTHNALLSLGPSTYLEVIAFDPELERPDGPAAFGLDGLDEPRLVTWALRTPRIDELAHAARVVGVGTVEAGSRRKPDGTTLSWKLTDPRALPLDGAVPFLIDWGATPHPATTTPPGGALVGLHLEHPEVSDVQAALAVLDVTMVVRYASTKTFVATVRTARGTVTIS